MVMIRIATASVYAILATLHYLSTPLIVFIKLLLFMKKW
jgi:hypothetical protein